MSETEILILEQRGSSGDVITYNTGRDRNELLQINSQSLIRKFYYYIANFFREVLLPYGYPHSVSEDYLEYQIWDTAQAFCSAITGAFTTRAILKSVGVGNAEASALSAAITWILKDGTGMIGRIMFAWWKGNGLDCDCKKWRLFADILNDCAMAIELVLPSFSSYSMPILCITSTMKSIVGIAGGATRASITHHQAIRGNMAEISAKDGTQETLVNLLASLASIYLLNIFTGSVTEWIFIFTLMTLHLLTNYMAVKALVFKNFNDQRLALVLKSYFTVGTVLSPSKINDKENVFVGFGTTVRDFCGFDITVGESLRKAIEKSSPQELQRTMSLYKDEDYLLVVDIDKKKINIAFEKDEPVETIVLAYFHAVCLGIITSIYNNIYLDIYSKRQLHHVTPISRLYTFMRTYERSGSIDNIPHYHLKDFAEFQKQESEMFKMALQINGWDLNSHCLTVGEWRSEWKKYLKKMP